MAKEIEITYEGLERILFAIDRVGDRGSRVLRNYLERVGSNAEYWMKFYAPHGESSFAGGRGLHSRIKAGNSRWRPGGLGGGGEWEVTAGVQQTGGGRYPIYVNSGTGLYRPNAPALIRAKPGRVMTFQKRGEPRRFVKWTRGQRAQPFLYLSWQQVLLYSRATTHRVGVELLHGV